jgi:hypothetical protein
MTMPCGWKEGGLGDFAGRVRFRRRFGYPGRIDEHERVWLTFDGVEGTARVTLNGQVVGEQGGAEGTFEFEVTSLLRQRNELAVEIESSTTGGGLWGEVALEVRCTAYLHDVRIWVDPAEQTTRLHVTGVLIGTCERPLELYVLCDRYTVLYTSLEPMAEGTTFHCTSEAFRVNEPGEHAVRVELVNGAVVWYAIEQTVTIA